MTEPVLERAPLRPEIELMILCARQQLSEAQDRRLKVILQNRVDWSFIKARGPAQRIQSFLFRHLCANGSGAAPAEFCEHLKRYYRMQAATNLRVRKQVCELGEAFERAGVPVVLLKGAYLAYWIYTDPALRPMADVDLLCRQEDWEAVSRAMTQLGYEQKAHGDGPAWFSLHPPPFLRPKSLHVEVHPNLRGASSDPLIERSRRVELDGVSFLTLGFVDLVSYLVVHAAQHFNNHFPLVWCADIHETIALFPDSYAANIRELSEQMRRDPTRAKIWEFIRSYWLDGVGTVAGGTGRHREIFGLLAGERRVHSGYLQALRNIRRFPGARQKLGHMRWLFFPPVHLFGRRYPGEVGIRLYLRYLSRFISIPAAAAKSLVRSLRSR